MCINFSAIEDHMAKGAELEQHIADSLAVFGEGAEPASYTAVLSPKAVHGQFLLQDKIG